MVTYFLVEKIGGWAQLEKIRKLFSFKNTCGKIQQLTVSTQTYKIFFF